MRLKNIFLCDAATPHPDNTFSVLRGGIDRSFLVDLNIPVKIALVSTIELDISERGRLHTAELSLLDADGGRVMPSLQLNFQPPAGNTRYKHNLIAEMMIKFNKFGEYCFYINVDGQELGTHSFYVIQAPSKTQQ
ncbi:MAG: hypothetical protein AMJ95_03355 [Omnitrophica WOR_2 bacterium SM23_72]|nr:MAG: hypothetical protein AMJ95_03355 [Omnitrophica WOR_2 bacterium SM23_72]